ncbi:hypothetical protein AMTRI_Chr03g49080 [Amborella trichopoda]
MIMPITPIFAVLEGFNCTIFAFWKTGAGKIYPMEGGSKAQIYIKRISCITNHMHIIRVLDLYLYVDFVHYIEVNYLSDVIPRAVHQIFDTFKEQKAHYSMIITFLEK